MGKWKNSLLIIIVMTLSFLFFYSTALSQDSCKVADNGSGTIDLPADCPYYAPYEPMYIIDGLPAGTTIELQPTFSGFICDQFTACSLPVPPAGCEGVGGSLGGNYHCFEGSIQFAVTGTGSLAGFNRTLYVPVSCEIHTAPRTPDDSIQTFAANMRLLSGQLFGDPDFCEFIIIAGTDSGLSCPGGITLTDIGGGLYNIDSFFDVTYRIQFDGCPGSQLEDYSGTTTATVRWQQGILPTVGGCCFADGSCMNTSESYCSTIGGDYQGNGTECLGDGDGDGLDDLCYEAGTCLAPDNGSGTIDLPADCPFYAPFEPMYIIDGLPAGTTIELQPTFTGFICDQFTSCSLTMPPSGCEGTGGSLGGNYHCFEGSIQFIVSGTGDLAGYSRTLWVPVSCEIHTAPRTPGDSIQTFAADIRGLFGQLFGDPDFCEFIIVAGTDSGLSSPGEITLTDLGNGYFNIDSFFDVSYRIQFQGCPGSPLDGYTGITTDSVRWRQGPPPPTGACCLPDGSCIEATEFECWGIGTYQGDGTICLGDYNGDGVDDACPVPPYCVGVDNGSGTVDLPANCPFYASDQPMYIIEGFPPGDSLKLQPILDDFFCNEFTPCSLSTPSTGCEGAGGLLGGNYECFESTLHLTVTGTGGLAGFNRHLAVPMAIEIHTSPRNPGDPVQSMAGIVYRLQGQLFGDPDFCEFIVTAGTASDLPGAGEVTITDIGGGLYNIDSFFDITYRIDFAGCPSSQLEDYSGATVNTVRLQQGNPQPAVTGACCTMDDLCLSISEAICLSLGGEYYGDDSECLGDNDDDGFDDLCVVPELPVFDLWETPDDGNTYFHFGCPQNPFMPPLPADYFGPGSDPFDGRIYFKGDSLQTEPPRVLGSTNTIVEREPANLPACPSADSVETEIIELNLVSTAPITVSYFGGIEFEDWFVRVCLSDVAPPPGYTIFNRDCEEGGSFQSELYIYPRFIFNKVSDPEIEIVFDFGAQGLPPVEYNAFNGNWMFDDPGLGVIKSIGGEIVSHCWGPPARPIGPSGVDLIPGIKATPCDNCQTPPSSYDIPLTILIEPNGCAEMHLIPPLSAGCNYMTGDVNGVAGYNGLDITYGVSYLKGGPEPACPFGSCPIPPCDAFFYCGDVNGSCNYNGLDITYGVAYLKGGPGPIPCGDCPPTIPAIQKEGVPPIDR